MIGSDKPSSLMSTPLFYIGLAGVPTNVMRWLNAFRFVADHLYLINSHPVVLRVVSFVAALGLAFNGQIKHLFLPSFSVELLPTAGQRPEMELRVTNLGKEGEFYTQCELLSLRHSPNALSQVMYPLKWDGTNNKRLFLAQGESANLLIARAKQDHKNGFAEMELLGLYGEEVRQYEWVGWNTSSRESLPEYDLRITVFREGAKKPLERSYTLKPKTFHGPLEMIEIASGGGA
jgi:hypothetical protein